MKVKAMIQLTLTAFAAVAVASPAIGAGVPRSQAPSDRGTHVRPIIARVASVMTGIAGLGESKNEAPFSAPFNADPGYSLALRKGIEMVARS